DRPHHLADEGEPPAPAAVADRVADRARDRDDDRSGVAPDGPGSRPGGAHHRAGGLAPGRAAATRLGIRGGRAPAGTRLDRLAPDREGPGGAGSAQRAAPGG